MRLLFIIMFGLIAVCSQAQQPIRQPRQSGGNPFWIGASFAYKTPRTGLIRNGYKEITANINSRVVFNRTLSAGIKFIPIYNLQKMSNEKKWYYMVGASAHINTFRYARNPFQIEVGFMHGNYCTCGDDTPFRKKSLPYLDIGIEYNLKIKDGLYVDFGGNAYTIISSPTVPRTDIVSLKTNYIYVVGINYKIGHKKESN